MESDPTSQETIPTFEALPVVSEVTDIGEPKGYLLLEQNYGEDPLKLALNTAIDLDVLIDKTYCSMDDGDEATVIDEDAQTFFDDMIDAFIQGDKADPSTGEDSNRAMSHLLQRFAFYEGCSVEFLKESLQILKSNKNTYFTNYALSDEESKTLGQEEISDDLVLLRHAARNYIRDSLERVSKKDVDAELEGIEPAIFEEFLMPFLMEERQSDNLPQKIETSVAEVIPAELLETFETKIR